LNGFIVFVFAIVIVIIFAMVIVYYFTQMLENKTPAQHYRGLPWMMKMKKAAEDSMWALSQGVAYFQLVVILTKNLNIKNIVTGLNGTMPWSLIVINTVALECLDDRLLEAYDYYGAIMLIPPFAICIPAVMFILGFFVSKVKSRIQWDRWQVACVKMALVLLNFLYFPISDTAIGAFQCKDYPYSPDGPYLSRFPYATCDSIPQGLKVVCLIVYPIGLFIFFVSILVLYHKKPEKRETIEKYFGFFYCGFKPKYIWASVIILLRRLLLSLTTGLMDHTSSSLYALNTIIIGASLLFTMWVHVYRSRMDNFLENLSLSMVLIVYWLALVSSVPTSLVADTFPVVMFYLCNLFMAIVFLGIFGMSRWPGVKLVVRMINGDSFSTTTELRPTVSSNVHQTDGMA